MVFLVRLSGRVNLRRSTVAVLGAAILLSGCSFASDSLWPSLTGDEPAGNASQQVSIPPSRAEMNSQPTYSAPPPPTMSGAPAPRMVAGNHMTGQPTGTSLPLLMGQKQRFLRRGKKRRRKFRCYANCFGRFGQT